MRELEIRSGIFNGWRARKCAFSAAVNREALMLTFVKDFTTSLLNADFK